MSLTEGWAVFVSAHESALNDLVTALTTARPHLLSYGSPAFTPASTRYDTAMAAIPFPPSPRKATSSTSPVPSSRSMFSATSSRRRP